MHAEIIIAFVAVTLSLIVIPGPDWAFILGTSAKNGRVVAPVLGLGVGYLLITMVIAGGLATVSTSNPWILDTLTLVGSSYLIYLGFGLLRHPTALTDDGEPAPVTISGFTLFRRGMAVAILNPKGLLFFLALLPQFVDPNGTWPLWQQLGTLGIIFQVLFCLFFLILGTTSKRVLSTRPSVATTVSRISGTAMILIALFLLVERALTLWG
ncbi:MAG: hypothetical protein RLZ72_328 [Actinomycetota bacterium]|jgi:threonine/homoserine/homoserine lactone efflux protein